MDSILGISQKVNVAISVDEIILKNDIAMSIGILVNEISLNACKYAFHQNDNPIFRLELKRKETGMELSVIDNGPGFSADVDWKNSPSFGMELIRSLARELKAELEVHSNESGVYYYFFIPQTHGS